MRTDVTLQDRTHNGRNVWLVLSVDYTYLPRTRGSRDEPPEPEGVMIDGLGVLTIQEEDGTDWTPTHIAGTLIIAGLKEEDYDEVERRCLAEAHAHCDDARLSARGLD